MICRSGFRVVLWDGFVEGSGSRGVERDPILVCWR